MVNQEASRAAQRRYYARNRERLREESRLRMRKTRAANPQKCQKEAREWRLAHPGYSADRMRKLRLSPEGRKSIKEWNRKHAQTPRRKLCQCLRNRINKALQGIGIKSDRTLALLGMEISEFRIYIQGQFRPGMTWENHGSVWHLDHIIACAKFDLSNPEQQKICFRWDNFQPLFVQENLSKGAK